MAKRSGHVTRLPLSFGPEDYKKSPPAVYGKPEILGDFSIDGLRKFCSDRSQMKFFDDSRFREKRSGDFKKVKLDLNAGMSKVTRISPEYTEKIDHLLR